MKTLKDRVAVVTGAAGGIGRAVSIELARNGCALAVSDVNEGGLAETTAAIRALGARVCSHTVNVADKERMRKYADEVAAEHGAVHILVNNAGVSIGGRFEEHTIEDWEWIMGVNFWGLIYGCKFFIPHLRRAGEGHIVNMSSMFGLAGTPLQSGYSTTKFAIRGLSETLWIELKHLNIGVTVVIPCGIRTEIANSMRFKNNEMIPFTLDTINNSPITPEDVARKIVQAILKNKIRILIGQTTYMIDLITRLSPTISLQVAQRGYRRGEFTSGIVPS
jgi:NAD(P)-dependent dehydrogenase (short-subunit alcohol dehydrogenase family)